LRETSIIATKGVEIPAFSASFSCEKPHFRRFIFKWIGHCLKEVFMKRKLFGIAGALVVLLALDLVLAGCPTDSDDSGGSGGGGGGPKKTITIKNERRLSPLRKAGKPPGQNPADAPLPAGGRFF
jgi:hypothetical protein